MIFMNKDDHSGVLLPPDSTLCLSSSPAPTWYLRRLMLIIFLLSLFKPCYVFDFLLLFDYMMLALALKFIIKIILQ